MKLEEIRQELQEDIDDGTINLDTIEEKERKRLIKQLLEHRALKRRGVRATAKAAQLDARLTSSRIGDAVSLQFFFACSVGLTNQL